MTEETLKVPMVMGWIAMMIVIALFVGVESLIGWTVIAGASVLPPLAMLWTWQDPSVTIAESIRRAIR